MLGKVTQLLLQDSHDASVFVFDNHTQCTMAPPSSVCRCCCNTDDCNRDILFCEGPLGGNRLLLILGSSDCLIHGASVSGTEGSDLTPSRVK